MQYFYIFQLCKKVTQNPVFYYEADAKIVAYVRLWFRPCMPNIQFQDNFQKDRNDWFVSKICMTKSPSTRDTNEYIANIHINFDFFLAEISTSMLNFWEQYSKQYHNKNEIWLIFFFAPIPIFTFWRRNALN